MATLAGSNPTLLDWAKTRNPDGTEADIVEILKQSNPVLDYMAWREANGAMNHSTTARTGLPTGTWRKFYGGVQPERSTSAQVVDTIGMWQTYAEVDAAFANLSGDVASFRQQEDKAFIQGGAHTAARYMIYGNEGTEPEAFTGFAPRYNSLSAQNAINVLSAGGSQPADSTSVWLIVWGDAIHGIFPKGSNAGLEARDLGEVTVENVDGNNGRAQMYRTHYKWHYGLSVRDWRQAVRICNIDVSDLMTLSGTQAITAATSVLRLMIQATERVDSLSDGRPTFLCTRRVREMLRMAIIDKTASNLSFETVAGKRLMMLDEIPVLRHDGIYDLTDGIVA
jgi:hypothetical protein